MLRRTLGLGLIASLTACNSQTASAPPPATSAPAAPAVSLADFKGDWQGKSLANANLRLLVSDRVGFEYANMPMNMSAPTFQGNAMRLNFASGDGFIEVTRKSPTELNWRYQGSRPFVAGGPHAGGVKKPLMEGLNGRGGLDGRPFCFGELHLPIAVPGHRAI